MADYYTTDGGKTIHAYYDKSRQKEIQENFDKMAKVLTGLFAQKALANKKVHVTLTIK